MKVIFTDKDYQRYRENRKTARTGCDVCPCCGISGISFATHLFVYELKSRTRFAIVGGKIVQKRIDRFACGRCNAVWESDPYVDLPRCLRESFEK